MKIKHIASLAFSVFSVAFPFIFGLAGYTIGSLLFGETTSSYYTNGGQIATSTGCSWGTVALVWTGGIAGALSILLSNLYLYSSEFVECLASLSTVNLSPESSNEPPELGNWQ